MGSFNKIEPFYSPGNTPSLFRSFKFNMSTVRFYQNNNRVATATYLKNGTILQVYPSKRNFASVTEFRNYWRDNVLNTLEFKETPRPTSKKIKAVKPNVSKEGWTFKREHTYTAPAGTYYIGDLCYALPDELYDGVFGQVGGYSSGLYKKDNDFFIMGGTAYGDGSYTGSDNKEFLVDAGIIGMAPISICDTTKPSISGGNIYTFEGPVKFRITDLGVFDIFVNGYRRLTIDTAGCDEDDEDHCDCCACEPR